jgi:glycosyltransferase involved in cell wall biosynthesis
VASVVVPMYNAQSTIDELLQSLALQDFEAAWEVVVVDNMSSDAGPTLATRWDGRLPHLRIVRATGRQGAGYARNVGTRASSGESIAYCDADDVVVPGWLSAVVSALEEAELVGSRFDVSTLQAGRRIDPEVVEPTVTSEPESAAFPWAGGSGLAIRRDVLERVGGWREDLPLGEDVDLSWRVRFAGGRIAFPDGAVVLWRPPSTLRARLRRDFMAGVTAPRLYRDHRGSGVPRRGAADVAASVARLIIVAPAALLVRSRRRGWLSGVVGQLGRCYGSLRYRVFFM